MTIWKRVRGAWSVWSRNKAAPTVPSPPPPKGDEHLALARDSLRELLDDPRVPKPVRATLAEDYRELQAQLDKLEHGHIHLVACGRVSVGKSALLNALLGEQRFAVSPLHGETATVDRSRWQQYQSGGVFLIDTPGLNEVDGEDRERLALEVAERADVVLFVVDGDLTAAEHQALATVAADHRPLLLVLNKADRYTQAELELLLASLRRHAQGLVPPDNVLACAADPGERLVLSVDAQGREQEERRRPPPDVTALQERLWALLDAEGKSLAAVNAGLFAGRLSDRLAAEILALRRQLADKVLRNYCLGKGVAVALNPAPLADLLTVAADAALIRHLSRVYGLPITRAEAGRLLATIMAQLAVLMGTVYGFHLASSALKGVSLGLSTVVTASAQGAMAWYGTYVIGRAAERYFAQGRSWGAGGPKRTVKSILDSLDRDSLLAQAREDILERLRGKPS